MLRSFLFIALGLLLFNGSLFSQNCPDISSFSKIGELDGHGYYLSENKLSWTNANQFAQQNGGYLVTMNSQEENEFVRQRLDNNMVFIGFNDKDQEGHPLWANGDQNIIDLSANNNNDNDFAVMNFWNGHWEFGNKWEQRRFVMEVDCGNSVPPTNSSPIQVFILAGQSNMSGAGKSNELDPVLKIVPQNADLRIHFYGNEYHDFSAGNFGPEVEFIHEITQDNPTQKYLFIKYAWGGTGMNLWMPGSIHYQTLMTKVYQALGSLNVDYELAGFLWMQGETDAFSPDDSGLYAQRFNAMVASLRNELGAPSLPVLIGQINPPNACCTATVQAAEADFVSNDTQSRLVLTDGLSRCWNDLIHYNTAGQIDLGHRFFASYQTLEPTGFALHCPENIVKVLGEGDSNITVSWVIDDVASNCDLNSSVQIAQILGASSGSAFDEGDFTISYAAMDDCQNKDTCYFNIKVKEFSACPLAVEGFTKLGTFDGHSYFLSENNLTWMEAQTFAVESGGYLATMNSNDENDFLKSKLNNNMVFIGVNDKEQEGVIKWANNEALSVNLVYDNTDENDFGVMNFWAGTWQMVNKWVSKPYIMEMDCESMDFEHSLVEAKSMMSPIYPNPAKNEISFDFDANSDTGVLFRIFNERGYLILAEKRYLPKGTSNVVMSIKNLPKGHYNIQSNISQQPVHFVKF